MRVSENHPLARQSIGSGRGDLARLRRQTLDVPVTEIVAHDEDNIRTLGRGGEDIAQEGTEKTEEERSPGGRRQFRFHHKIRAYGE